MFQALITVAPAAGHSKKSQRDFIIQPSVVTMKSWLRWVVNYKLKSTLNGLYQIAAKR